MLAASVISIFAVLSSIGVLASPSAAQTAERPIASISTPGPGQDVLLSMVSQPHPAGWGPSNFGNLNVQISFSGNVQSGWLFVSSEPLASDVARIHMGRGKSTVVPNVDRRDDLHLTYIYRELFGPWTRSTRVVTFAPLPTIELSSVPSDRPHTANLEISGIPEGIESSWVTVERVVRYESGAGEIWQRPSHFGTRTTGPFTVGVPLFSDSEGFIMSESVIVTYYFKLNRRWYKTLKVMNFTSSGS